MPLRLILFLVVCVLLAQASFLLAKGPVSYLHYGLQNLLWTFHKVAINPQLITASYYLLSFEKYTQLFGFLFLFRYIRLVVSILGFWIYKPIPIPSNPTLTSKDATVIVQTVNPFNLDFAECVFSIAATKPASIIIVTAGEYKNFKQASTYSNLLPQSGILVLSSPIVSKRHQIALSLSHTITSITILCDDHVFWPPTFMPHLLAPFHNQTTGAVCTNKCIRRTSTPGALTWASYCNLMGVLYLERCSFDTCATNAVDGGVFVLSGRTVGYRTSILRDPACVASFLGERIGTGRFRVGPLDVDDDNFNTRWIISHGWKIQVQAPWSWWRGEDGDRARRMAEVSEAGSEMESDDVEEFIERTIIGAYPWSTSAIYTAHFFNFALFYDLALLSTLHLQSKACLFALSLWILASKLVKVAPYFAAYPKDLVLLPGHILFGWFHSLIKLYALFTMWDMNWAGRQGLDDGDAIGTGKAAVDVSFFGASGTITGLIDRPSDKNHKNDGTNFQWPQHPWPNTTKTFQRARKLSFHGTTTTKDC
ncbi:MAG: hypothetical protein Q9195_005133 [Heterodermia aff. obscurata]